jgi:hypothetical protein
MAQVVVVEEACQDVEDVVEEEVDAKLLFLNNLF